MNRRRFGSVVLTAAILAAPVVPAKAAECHAGPIPRLGAVPAVLGANALLGGLTAGVRAAAGRRNPVRPFLLGTLGGATHFSGKYVTLAPQGVTQVVGLAVSSFGASVVANAGAGIGITEELYVPVGPARLRFRRDRGFHVALNAYESAALIHIATRADRRFDVNASLAFGSFVLRDGRLLRSRSGGDAAGETLASVVVVSDQARNPDATLVHEVVHTRQHWYVQETIGRPVETAIRSHVPVARFLPEWLELGVTVPLITRAERLATPQSPGPYYRAKQYEAELIECRKFG